METTIKQLEIYSLKASGIRETTLTIINKNVLGKVDDSYDTEYQNYY